HRSGPAPDIRIKLGNRNADGVNAALARAKNADVLFGVSLRVASARAAGHKVAGVKDDAQATGAIIANVNLIGIIKNWNCTERTVDADNINYKLAGWVTGNSAGPHFQIKRVVCRAAHQ